VIAEMPLPAFSERPTIQTKVPVRFSKAFGE
jgi:hypothetical protein